MNNRVSVKIGDKIYTDEMVGVRYTSSKPEIRRQPTGWQRIIRAITPRRFRKPLPIVRPAEVGGMTIRIGGDSGEQLARYYECLSALHGSAQELVRRD